MLKSTDPAEVPLSGDTPGGLCLVCCDSEEVVARLYSVAEDKDSPRISLTLIGLCWSTGKGFKVSKLPPL